MPLANKHVAAFCASRSSRLITLIFLPEESYQKKKETDLRFCVGSVSVCLDVPTQNVLNPTKTGGGGGSG